MPPDAIATKLREVLGDRDDAPVAGVTGQGDQENMALFVYRPNLQNSLQTQLIATLTPDGAGTRIAGRIGAPRGGSVALGCWFGFLILFVGIIAATAVQSGEWDSNIRALIAIPLAMMGFGVLLWKLGNWNAAKDEAAILDFLAREVRARAE